MQENFYKIDISESLQNLITEADGLKDKIDKHKPMQDNLWSTIQAKLRIQWTYNSNAIEGSSLSLGETTFFLQNGLTVEGKPFKDFADAKNHSEAIDYLYDVIKNSREITPSLLKEFNAFLLNGLRYTAAVDEFGNKINKPAHPGSYKKQPNHVLQPDGTIHKYVDPVHVPSEMEYLCNWVDDNSGKIHPVLLSAAAHYNFVRIHPFDDGNGRGARILMNLILIKAGYPPAIIRNEERRKYLNTLTEADSGNLNPFAVFAVHSCVSTFKMILEDLEKNQN